eukprot:3438805-Prymnesium_polylepis.1
MALVPDHCALHAAQRVLEHARVSAARGCGARASALAGGRRRQELGTAVEAAPRGRLRGHRRNERGQGRGQGRVAKRAP